VPLHFRILDKIRNVETIASGREIREHKRLTRIYGAAKWRKRKGFSRIELNNGTILQAELHWYEAHGIGRKEFKIKRFFQDNQ